MNNAKSFSQRIWNFWGKHNTEDFAALKAAEVVEAAKTFAVQSYFTLSVEQPEIQRQILLKIWENIFSIAFVTEFCFQLYTKANPQEHSRHSQIHLAVLQESLKSGMKKKTMEDCQTYVIDMVQKGQNPSDMIGAWILVNSKPSQITEKEFLIARAVGASVTVAASKLLE